jgi:signal transduction histidine kinase
MQQPMGSTVSEGAERKRVEAVVETLAAMHNHGESLGELAHDARNMVTALSLYCDLLEEPGVLPPPHRHYGSELRLVAEASRRLVEKLVLLDSDPDVNGDQPDGAGLRTISVRQGQLFPVTFAAPGTVQTRPAGLIPNDLIEDLGAELLASRNLLAAIAGPSIALGVVIGGRTRPVSLSSEDLLRCLVNLVKNAAEFITGPGAIRISLGERQHEADALPSLFLSVEDSGSGIPDELLEKIFEPGFTTRPGAGSEGTWASTHRGLGLSITRSIVEAAGGRIHAENSARQGARFVIELPIRRG